MLQNIRILVGQLPPKTGDLQNDYDGLRSFLENLLRGLETNFDALGSAVEQLSKEEQK